MYRGLKLSSRLWVRGKKVSAFLCHIITNGAGVESVGSLFHFFLVMEWSSKNGMADLSEDVIAISIGSKELDTIS